MKGRDDLNILNQEFFELMKKFRDDNNLQKELTDNECICYANMLSVFYDITNNELPFAKLLQTYDFVTDIIDGSCPDIMIIEDEYRDIYRILKRYSITKNLNDETLKKVAFLIYQAKCVIIMNEETQQPTWNMQMFEKGTQSFLKEYEYEIKEYPSKFEIKKPISDPTRADYGLSLENPIEVSSISAEYQYLNILLTSDGKETTYEQDGSGEHSSGTMIDIYKIYTKKLIGKKEIATIYISGYGIENTLNVPKGFRLMTEEEIEKSENK